MTTTNLLNFFALLTNALQKPPKVAVVRIEDVDFFSDKQAQILQCAWMMTVNAILEETPYTEIESNNTLLKKITLEV